MNEMDDTLNSTIFVLEGERKTLTGSIARYEFGLALLERAEALGVKDKLTQQVAARGISLDMLDKAQWVRRLEVLRQSLDEVEDDLQLLDRLGSEADLGAIAFRGMDRQLRLLDVFDDE